MIFLQHFKATENLSEEKLQEFKDIFSYFDRLLNSIDVFIFKELLQRWRRIHFKLGVRTGDH